MTARGRSAIAVSIAAALTPAFLVAAPASALPLETPTVRATGLSTPWGIAFAPGDRVLVTERSNRATDIDAAPPRIVALGAAAGDPVKPVFVDTSPGITPRKFLGLALSPDFVTNGFAYLYETYTQGGVNQSRVLRLRADGEQFVLDRVILDGIASDLNHDGGRIAFEGLKLLVTTGDVHDPALPRNRQSLNGKILRLNAWGDDQDGTPATDNPFYGEGGNARYVWSYGHRHPQGIARDTMGRLWETEHGPSGEGHAPSGANTGRDELNRIERGGDYGWPAVAGTQTLAGTIPPVVHSGPAPAWAPGGLALGNDGLLYAPMLNGRHLRAFSIDPCTGAVTGQTVLYAGTYGRLRSAESRGGVLWLTTDDGRVLSVRVTSSDTMPMPALVCGQAPPPAAPPAPPAGPKAPPSTTPKPTPLTRAVLADRLLSRSRVTVGKLSVRALLRRGSFSVQIGGLDKNRAVVRLMSGRVTVARGVQQPGSRKTVAVRARLTAQGRKLLRGKRGAVRLTLRTDVLASGAKSGVVRRATVKLSR